MKLPKGSRDIITTVLSLGLYALPIWFFSAHKGRPIYTGYSVLYAVPLIAALLFTWLAGARESRTTETVTIGALTGLQVVSVYLLDQIVGPRDYTRVWLQLAIPATIWIALVLIVNRMDRWVSQTGDSGDAGAKTYGERSRMLTSMVLTWCSAMFVLAVVTTFWAWARPLYDNRTLFFLGFFACVFAGLGVSALVEERVHSTRDRQPTIDFYQKGVPEAVAIEVHSKLAWLSRLRLSLFFGAVFMAIGVALLVYLALGQAAEGYVLLLFVAGQTTAVILMLAAGPWYGRRWHKEVEQNGIGLEHYKKAAANTPLAFPEQIE